MHSIHIGTVSKKYLNLTRTENVHNYNTKTLQTQILTNQLLEQKGVRNLYLMQDLSYGVRSQVI